MNDMGYLDFHCHLLPGVDDGSKSMEITKQMLEKEYEQGVRRIIATPHNYPGGKPQDNKAMIALCHEVDELAGQIDKDFRVMPGNEIFFRESILQELEEETILTMAGSRYLLVEFSTHEHYHRIRQGISELIQAGYYPVIAHVERVHRLFEEEANIAELIEMGCYMQANCEDFMGGVFDRQSSKLRKLLGNGQIHFLGSDSHNTDTRPPMMSDCIDKLYKKLPEDVVDRVAYTNQMRFLDKKYI